MTTAEQEREFREKLEGRRVEHVKRQLEHNEISPSFVFVASQWVSDKEREAEQRREVSNSEQTELAKRAAAAAERASTAADRAAAAAERQALAAERANTRATIALVIAVISMIVSAAIGIWSAYH